jgi:hypothetical protein
LRSFIADNQDETIPFSSTLEVLHLTRTRVKGNLDDLVFQSAPASIVLIPASFATWLRSCPRLHVVNYIIDTDDPEDFTLFDRLDGAEAAGDVTARIYSMRHDDREVLHARIQLQPVDTERDYDITRERVLFYNGGHHLMEDLMEDYRTVKAQYPPEWQDYSEFAGEAVPIAVIREMRAVEGLSEDGWKVRGVEVGAAAWDVLEAWRAAGSPAE